MSAALSGLLRLRRRAPRRRPDAADAVRSQGPGARSTASSRSSIGSSRCTCRSSAASRWSAIASSTCCCRSWRERGLYVQVVTSAVRPIPIEWAAIPRLQICVSIDGLQPEHDVRRTPATYDRILKHIEGHQITVHCTVTRQQAQRDGYIEEFVRTWSDNPNVRIDLAEPLHAAGRRRVRRERLPPDDRVRVVDDAAAAARARSRSCRCRRALLDAYLRSARLARRLHLRADHRVPVGGSADADHAVPVRRQARLRQLRLHGVAPEAVAASVSAVIGSISARSVGNSCRIARAVCHGIAAASAGT